MKKYLELTVNGEAREAYVEPWWTLQDVLRREFGLFGVKSGCETGHCGSCTILIDGKAVKSCLVLALQVKDKKITTIEGLASKDNLHPLQKSFLEHFAFQCGFCTPGMILTAKAMLDENPRPTEEEVKRALNGNLCRCTGYVKIIEAILAVGDKQ